MLNSTLSFLSHCYGFLNLILYLRMKKLLLVLLVAAFLRADAQSYTFSQTTGTYTNLAGNTLLLSGDWDYFEKGIKLPFTFRYWGVDYSDSLYADAYGSLSLDDNFNEELTFFGEDLISRATDRSPVSYVVEGSAPNRILKLEIRNTGINKDTTLQDSAHVQCWIFETTNVIEFHYGPNSVKNSTWSEKGAWVGIVNESMNKYIILEGNPLNPVLNKTDLNNASTLTGMPANGSIYKFTPGNGSGLKPVVAISPTTGGLSVPETLQVMNIKLYNVNGQLLQAATNVGEITLGHLGHGVYIVVLETTEGCITHKLLL